jgi:transcription initiation factor TFIIA small subunit
MSSGMNYQLYRNTTLGTTLIDSLDELIQQQAISHSLRQKVLEEVNRSFSGQNKFE